MNFTQCLSYSVFSVCVIFLFFFFFSSRRRHTRLQGDWSSDVCSSDLIPRRRSAGGELLHGAPDRRGGARDGDRPAGIAPAQPRAAAGDPVQGRLGDDVRQRGFWKGFRKSPSGWGREELRPSKSRSKETGQAARARDRQLPRGDGAAEQGNGGRYL